MVGSTIGDVEVVLGVVDWFVVGAVVVFVVGVVGVSERLHPQAAIEAASTNPRAIINIFLIYPPEMFRLHN